MKLFYLLLGLGLLSLSACATMKPLPGSESAARFEAPAGQGTSFDYLAYLPGKAAQHPRKKWPTILFLHGSGERGTNVWLVAKHGPPKIAKDKADFQFIVISPQCPPRQKWEVASLTAFVQEMKKKYPIDDNRLYLTGLSMGGAGTWKMLLAQPDLFAAAAPVCGRADPAALTGLESASLQTLKALPIWVFHGAKDPTVPLSESQTMVKALKDIGANVKLTIYPEATHDSWTETYNNPEFYRWLLRQERKSAGQPTAK